MDAEAGIEFQISKGWSKLPIAFKRMLLRDALLLEPSPLWVEPPSMTEEELAEVAQKSRGRRRSSAVQSLTRRKTMVTKDLLHASAGGMQFYPDRPLGFGRGKYSVDRPNMSAAMAIAATRWLDTMDAVFVLCDQTDVEDKIAELHRRTSNGLNTPSPDLFSEISPIIAELMRDSSSSLLGLVGLPRAYALFTTALARLMSLRVRLEEPAEGRASSKEARGGFPESSVLVAACNNFCERRRRCCEESIEEVQSAEESGESEEIERACTKAMGMDITAPYPFLARAQLRLRERKRCHFFDDVRAFLWWSTRSGVRRDWHSRAYWAIAEAMTQEMDEGTSNYGTFMEDKTLISLADQAEQSLRLAAKYGNYGNFADHAAARQLFERIEAHRAKRRPAADFSDSSVLLDASRAAEEEPPEPLAADYALPWPIDLTSGLPDSALFSRMPTVASALGHEPLNLLFLDARGVLDILASMHALASRSSAYAQRNAECLHWKYRPKPVNVHMVVPKVERLAHALLCLMVAKQIGTVPDNPLDQARADGSLFSPEETENDRFYCGLLTALIFCRSLSGEQRAEVDRLLSLLVMASMSESHMRRAFPWLDLDDCDQQLMSGGKDMFFEDLNLSQLPRHRNIIRSKMNCSSEQNAAAGAEAAVSLGLRPGFGQSVVLFKLQHVWLGWLASATGEGPIKDPDFVKLDTEAVHSASRKRLLGTNAASFCSFLDVRSAQAEGLSERIFWAVTGNLSPGRWIPEDPPQKKPKPAEDLLFDEEEDLESRRPSKAIEEQVVAGLRPEDLRMRWRAKLWEATSGRASSWKLNPCVLDPVSWDYDPGALADPFRTHSWYLSATCVHPSKRSATPWYANPSKLTEPFDGPVARLPPRSMDPSTSHWQRGHVSVLEALWELFMPQLKSFSTTLNASDVAEAAYAKDHMPASSNSEQPFSSGSKSPQFDATGISISAQPSTLTPTTPPKSANKMPLPLGSSKALLQLLRSLEVTRGDAERELAEVKERHHVMGLNMELRDYLTLSSVRKKEDDWWGAMAQDQLYWEAKSQPVNATWDPAPPGCAPLRLRLRVSEVLPWRTVKASLCRRVMFDAIDARSLLCRGGGLLALCTHLDTILKSTPHAYIQTRQCEELFLQRLKKISGLTLAENVTAGVGNPVELPDLRLPTPAPRAAAALTSAAACVLSPRSPAGQDVPLPKGPKTLVGPNGLLARRALCEAPRVEGKYQPKTSRSFLKGRLLPAPIPPRSLERGGPLTSRAAVPPAQKEAHLAGEAALGPTHKAVRPPEYVSESALFERLSAETLSTKLPGSQIQHMLGVAVRAEPLSSELGFDYLGISRLPVRHDFLRWDSSLESAKWMGKTWPSTPGQFSEEALGGTQPGPRRMHTVEATEEAATRQANTDPLATAGRYWPKIPDEELAKALGPRLLRVRRLDGHPSLSPPIVHPSPPAAPPSRRCANAAFCSRLVVPETPNGTQVPRPAEPGHKPDRPIHCGTCGCAWYCSPACQATHRPAHDFECRALLALQQAARGFERREPERNMKTLVSWVELLLAKQFSMVSQPEALVGRTAMADDLRSTIAGRRATVLPGAEPGMRSTTEWTAKAMGSWPMIDWSQVLMLPHSLADWKVLAEGDELEGKSRGGPGVFSHSYVPGEAMQLFVAGARKAMFDVALTYAHATPAVVRILARWALVGARAPALRQVVNQGLVFGLVTGLCQTKPFLDRKIPRHALASILTHRMGLHIAVSQEWGTLHQTLVPPLHMAGTGAEEFLDLDRPAQYCEYYAFFKPVRLPFLQMRPLLPIACLVWTDETLQAILAMPQPTPRRLEQRTQTASEDSFGSSGHSAASTSLVTFFDITISHLGKLQLLDPVLFDPLTGKASFLLYSSVVKDPEGLAAWIVLLDASRGMQAISTPVPINKLRPLSREPTP